MRMASMLAQPAASVSVYVMALTDLPDWRGIEAPQRRCSHLPPES